MTGNHAAKQMPNTCCVIGENDTRFSLGLRVGPTTEPLPLLLPKAPCLLALLCQEMDGFHMESPSLCYPLPNGRLKHPMETRSPRPCPNC